jgi:hypothetical protein
MVRVALLLAAVMVGAGLIACAVAGLTFWWLDGPDTEERADDDERLTADDFDRGDPLGLARAIAVDVTPDGSHDDLADVDAGRWAAEMALLEAAYQPPMELPIIPGREKK